MNSNNVDYEVLIPKLKVLVSNSPNSYLRYLLIDLLNRDYGCSIVVNKVGDYPSYVDEMEDIICDVDNDLKEHQALLVQKMFDVISEHLSQQSL